MITTCVQDPDIYDPANVLNESDRDLLGLFLKTAGMRHVTLVDSAGMIEGALRKCARGLSQDESIHLYQCLKRMVAVPVPEDVFKTLKKTEAYLDESALEHCTSDARISALALAADSSVDAVVVSQRDRDALEVMLPGQDELFAKAQTVGSFLRKTSQNGEPVIDSILGWTREDVFNRVFSPLMRWSKSIIIIDKHIGSAYVQRNWNDFRLTINWLRRCWQQSCRVEKRVAMQVITMPPRDDKGRMLEPNDSFAEKLWKGLGSWSEIQVRVVKPQMAAFREEGLDDISHDRYLIAMPQDFVVTISRGFDLLTEDGGETIRKAATIGLLPCQPPDVEAILRVRGTGCKYPA